MSDAFQTRLPASALACKVMVALVLTAGPAAAQQQVSREQDITDLRLGQRVQVDDGSCPNGQIKEVLGATLTATGITRTSKCVQRVQRR
jgi:hypothetical protein